MKTAYDLPRFWTSMSAIFGFTFHIGRMTEVLTPDIYIYIYIYIYRAHWNALNIVLHTKVSFLYFLPVSFQADSVSESVSDRFSFPLSFTSLLLDSDISFKCTAQSYEWRLRLPVLGGPSVQLVRSPL